MNEINVLYTAEATVTGGREGHGRTSDGRLDVDFDIPTEMSGTGGPGTNPEQLFATGWAACFQSSMQRYASARKVDLRGTRITSRIGIGPLKSGGLGLVAALDLDAPGLSRADAVYLMERAHETCPYSRATRATSTSRSPSAAPASSVRPPEPPVLSSTTRGRFPRRVVGRREHGRRREAAPDHGSQLSWSQRLLAALLLLGPLVVALDRLDAAGALTLFVLAAAALVPLSWLIGEATDNLAGHTGPGIGGFVNAKFGNAPD